MMYYLYSIDFPNGKRYIGITDNPSRRWSMHKAHARANRTKQFVHKAIRKYGETNLKLRILVIGTREYIRELERKAIEVFNTRNDRFGYNIALGGEISPVAGIGHTEASRAKMSISQKNRDRPPETWIKFATSRLGKPLSKEHKEKLSCAAKRKWAKVENRRSSLTLERLKKIRETLARNCSRKEIAVEIGLSEPRARELILEVLNEPILTED